MSLETRSAAVHLGDGVVARWPGAIVCLPPADGVGGLIERLDAALAVGGSDPGPGRVLEALDELAADGEVTFAAVVAVEAGLRALVAGHAEIASDERSIVGSPGELAVADLPDGGGPLVLRGLGDASNPGRASFDLRAGVVPGRAVTLARRADADMPVSPAPETPPPPPAAPLTGADVADEVEPAADADFEVLDLSAGIDDGAAPLPVLQDADLGGGEDAGGELVGGILCSRGHFNNPLARYCMVCGISMVHLTHRIVERPRPTLGFAVFDDGATYAFDRSYVVGRDPEDEAIDRGADPLLLDDAERTVSRAHAEIRLVDWDVVLVDLGSTNGTFVWNPPAGRWDRLDPGVERRLESGAAVSIGRRTFVFESVHRTAPASGPTSTPPPPPELG